MKQFDLSIDTPFGRVSVDQDARLPAIQEAARQLEDVLGWLDSVEDALYDLDKAVHHIETLYRPATLIQRLRSPFLRTLQSAVAEIEEAILIKDDIYPRDQLEDALFYIEEYLDYLVSEQDDRWPGDR